MTNTVGLNDLKVGRRYKDGGGDAFVVLSLRCLYDDVKIGDEGYLEMDRTDDKILGPFTPLDPRPAEPDQPPEPATPVRTKAETLGIMKSIAESLDKSHRWASLTDDEYDLLMSGYRALFEKLKESL